MFKAYIRDGNYLCPRWRPADRMYRVIASVDDGYLVILDHGSSGGREVYYINDEEIYYGESSSTLREDSNSDDGESGFDRYIDDLYRDVQGIEAPRGGGGNHPPNAW